MPYYWKRGLLVGLVVGVMLHLLLLQLASRQPELPEGNIPVAATQRVPHKTTPLGPLMGIVIFTMCCVMPGPQGGKVGT